MTYWNRNYQRGEWGLSDPMSRVAAHLAISLFALLCTVPANAHDFFLLPPAPSVESEVVFQVGHHGEFDAWNHGLTHVLDTQHILPDGSVSNAVRIGESSATIDTSAPGTHLLALSSQWSESTLAPKKFLAYLNEEGLAHIATLRQQAGQENESGVERYSRRAKTIIQRGTSLNNSVTEALGLDLELVPATNPHSLAANEPLNVTLLFRGKPLEGAKVELESLSIDGLSATTYRTDKNGHATLAHAKRGAWKIHTIWSVPDSSRVNQFETLFASLTFTYEP